MSTRFDIYAVGVGGQGIGLLAEALARAALAAGIPARGCDTHGLAQRGGVVASHVRLGPASSPLVPEGAAHLVVALERHEAMRALSTYMAPGGTLAWCDLSLQGLETRLGKASEIGAEDIERACARLGVLSIRIDPSRLEDSRAVNVAALAALADHALPPGVGRGHFKAALEDLLDGESLRRNLEVLG
jgi:indolepyruvate ferredoxin oxidoreductase beta subunit